MIAHAVGKVGQRTRTYTGDLRLVQWLGFTGAMLRSAAHHPRTAWPFLLRTVVNQVRFTAVQALPFAMLIALAIGITVIVQAHAQAVRFGFLDPLGRILVTVVVRELGPLVTAIIVIGRSGTAIAAEIATGGVVGETDAMEAMGVNPLQYLVVPRVLGLALSVPLLTVYFVLVTLMSGAVLTGLWGQISLAEYTDSLRVAFSVSDLWLTLVKAAVFGGGIAVLCSYEGLAGGHKPTDIAQCVTRGVVASLSFVFVVSALFSWALYRGGAYS